MGNLLILEKNPKPSKLTVAQMTFIVWSGFFFEVENTMERAEYCYPNYSVQLSYNCGL